MQLSKELSSTPRSKVTASRQYKPWMSRKRKGDEGPAEVPVVLADPVEPVIDEIPEKPVVKPTKKKHQQRQQPPSPSAHMTSLPVEGPPPVITAVEE